ncbi:MAG: polysaccharide biosynthesis tyrosine autokinase [Xanthobacteraceae bacterium]
MLTADKPNRDGLEHAEIERPGSGAAATLLDMRGAYFMLCRNARLITSVTAGTLAVLAIALALIPPRYTATAILLVDPRQQRVTSAESVLPGIGDDVTAVESQVDLITSPALSERVIGQLKLQDDPEFAPDGILARLDLLAPPEPQTRSSLLRREFQRQLGVRRRGQTYVIEVNFTSKDAAKAARIANAIATTYRDDQRTMKLDATAKASEWLDDRIRELRLRVNDSERAVATYKAEHNLIDTGQGIRLIERQIETLSQQLILARAAAAEAQARLAQVESVTHRAADPSALSEALQSTVISNLRTQYAQTAASLADLSATLGDHHPSLLRLRAQAGDLRHLIDIELTRIRANVRNEFDVAASREKSLEADLAKLKEQAAKTGQDDVRLAELQREAQANRALFDELLLRSKETSAQQSLQISDAQVISAATIPARPNRPTIPLLVGAAAAFGIVLGIGVALTREHFDRTFRSAGQVERDLGLHCLGIAPFAVAHGAGRGLFSAVLDLPGSPLAESVHAVRARLRLKRRVGLGSALMVVSALPNEGKSVVASNLAHAAALAGLRTVLIDLDLRSGSLTAAGGHLRPGLVDVLRGKAELEDAMMTDSRSGLSFLGTGDRRDVFKALLDIGDERLATLLDQCRQTFDCAVVDSAAILHAPETSELIDHVDRALMLVEWHRTDRDTVEAALEALGERARKVTGVVLNKTDLARYRLYDHRPSRRFALSAAEVTSPAT